MAKTNTKALSCTIDLGNFDRLAELRWEKRVETMSEMVNLAIAEYVDKHNPKDATAEPVAVEPVAVDPVAADSKAAKTPVGAGAAK